MAKKTPEIQRLEEVLRSSKLAYGGFMGEDSRSVLDVIDADAAELSKLSIEPQKLAEKMQQITDLAKVALGNWVKIDENRRAMARRGNGYFGMPLAASGQIRQTRYDR